MPLLRHFDHLNTARFVTFSCFHRYRLLTATPVLNVFIHELNGLRARHNLKLYGYVVMPEHVHLVMWLPDTLRLGAVIGELKSYSAKRVLPLLKFQQARSLDRLTVVRRGIQQTVFWQSRCYDHNCRTCEAVSEKIEYCHNNPVKRGLAAEPGDWLWSSYNWYVGRTDVPIQMDEPDF